MSRSGAEPRPRVESRAAPSLRLPATGEGPLPSQRRRPIANGVLAMAIFLASETMLFAGLITALLVLRAGAASWPPPGQPRLPVAVTALNTVVLLLSGYTMHRATGGSGPISERGSIRWLAVTTGLGATFLLVQGAEWVRLVRHGLRVSSGLYGGSFYTLIGFHGAHVVVAVLTLVVLLATLRRGRNPEWRQQRLEVCRLYWLFVVAVWPVLYVLVYLA